MSLLNQHWINMAGDTVTGRPPPRLRIMNDNPITEQQYGAVAHAYKLFTDAVNVSVTPFLIQNRTLTDGSRVRLESNQGVDTVLVWPEGGGSDPVFDGLFLGVASSTTNKQGLPALGPSALWKKYPKSHMPDTLTPKFTLDNHPGHVTWTGKGFKTQLGEVVLSWRGPSSRYARSTGWSINTGGTVVSHTDNTESMGTTQDTTTLYKDTSYVWFNGVKVNTGIQKIMAAALHRPDPNVPGLMVLRVCSDMYPNPSTTRGCVAYDLVPTGTVGTAGASIENIVAATAFTIIATYVATGFRVSPTASGQWRFLQRPHFNNDGSKIAGIVHMYGATSTGTTGLVQTFAGAFGVAFNPETWEVLESVSMPTTYSNSETRDETNIYNPATNAFVNSSSTVVKIDGVNTSCLGGVDFLDDRLVYWFVRRNGVTTSTDTSTYSENPSAYVSSWLTTEVITVSVEHSLNGVLVSYTDTRTVGGSGSGGSFSAGTGNHSDSGYVNDLVSFVGDLSKNIYAIGWSAQKISSASGSGATAVLPYSSDFAQYVQGQASDYAVRLVYDVFVGKKKVYTGNQSHTVLPPATSTGTASLYSFSNRAAAVRFNGVSNGAWATTSSYSNADAYGFQSRRPYYTAYEHAAVAPKQVGAYLGISHIDYGLEVSIRKTSKSGKIVYVAESVPVYVPGDLPTISAPIFLSYLGEAPP